jgi:hypothetical protein
MGFDLFSATSFGFVLSKLGRRQVGERCICFRGQLRGCWFSRPDGSAAAAAGAGSTLEGSVRVDDSGATVVVSGFSWSCTTLAALMMSKSLLYKPTRARYLCD